MTQVHELKCWPDSFEQISAGHKTFELRKDDRGYKVGDYLLLREWTPMVDLGAVEQQYTGRNAMAVVTHILREADTFGDFLREPDTVAMAIKLLARGVDKNAQAQKTP